MSTQNLWTGTKAADAPGFKRLPLGLWPGTIKSITEKTVKTREMGERLVYEMDIDTDDHGTTQYSIWHLDEADLERDGVEKFKENVARRKKMIVELGLAEPNTMEDFLDRLNEIADRGTVRCALRVVAAKDKPGTTMTFLEGPQQAQQHAAAGKIGGGMRKPAAPASAAPIKPAGY